MTFGCGVFVIVGAVVAVPCKPVAVPPINAGVEVRVDVGARVGVLVGIDVAVGRGVIVGVEVAVGVRVAVGANAVNVPAIAVSNTAAVCVASGV